MENNQTKEPVSNFTKVIFGFADVETGNKLRKFYKKHTGLDIDFISIRHYKNGFKLLVFDLPLGKFSIIGISAAACAPYYVKRFNKGIDDFIYWYESNYLVFKKKL